MKECNIKWDPISSKKLKHDGIAFFTDKMKKNLHVALNDTKFITLTVDGWSDRRDRSFIGVTCHFINYKCEPQALLIDFVRLKGSHTVKISIEQLNLFLIDDDNSNEIKLNSNTNTTFDDNDYDMDINDLEFMDISYAEDYEDIENHSDLHLSCFIHSCQAETAVTASLVVPSIVHLISHLHDIKPDISLCLKLVQQLEESITTCFSGIINRLNLVDVVDNSAYGDPIYFIAAVLDPLFKFLWIRDLKLPVPIENRLKQHIIELIINEVKKDLPASTIKPMKINFPSTSSSISSSSSTATTPQRTRRKLFNYDDNIINDSNASSSLDPAVELDAFLNDP
ncbi:unnamed protein product, partial [Rotaria sp. Silwood2]